LLHRVQILGQDSWVVHLAPHWEHGE
jgi:hypothetical protein